MAASASGTNRMTGRSAFLALLKSEGVTHLFGNPGTTELPIMHALAEHPDLKFVMAMQESLVVAMADGYSRASGELVAANVHVAPGLGNAMGSLYNAKFTGTPIILTAGQQEQGHGLMEPLLYGPMLEMAAPLVKWAVEVNRLEDMPRIIRRAAKVAKTPPTGPVFISLPGDILNAEVGLDLLTSTRVDTRVRPSDDVLTAFAERILKADRPCIIVGDECVKSDAHAAVCALAEMLGVPVYQQSIAYGAHFPSKHPCFMGALTRQQPTTRKMLEAYDLLIALGTDPVRMSVYNEVDESLTSGRYTGSLFEYTDRYSFHALASGGIGWGLPAAVGVAIANPKRRVAAYVGDGSAMYSIQALWTAAHHKLPITYVIPNNGGYRIIKQRLKAFHGSSHFIGMDFQDPAVDYAGLAKSFGMASERVSDPAKLPAALAATFKRPGPSLIEVMVDGTV